MADTQHELDFGNSDPAWREFCQVVGQPAQPRAKRRKTRDKAIAAIRQLKAANQQRLRQERREGS